MAEGERTKQLRLVDLTTGKKEELPSPQARPRDPWSAESLEEFRSLWLQKFGQVCGSREQLDFLDAHPEEPQGIGRELRREEP